MAEILKIDSPKLYKGVSADDRRRERAERLIEAAVKVFGRAGYRDTTVKAICDAAGLTERYFYESFANKEAMLVASFEAVYDYIHTQMRQAADDVRGTPAVKVHHILTTFYGALVNDPASARVFLVEIGRVSAAVDERFASAVERFADLLFSTANSQRDQGGLARAGAVGAIRHIALAWIARDYRDPVAEVADAAIRHVML